MAGIASAEDRDQRGWRAAPTNAAVSALVPGGARATSAAAARSACRRWERSGEGGARDVTVAKRRPSTVEAVQRWRVIQLSSAAAPTNAIGLTRARTAAS